MKWLPPLDPHLKCCHFVYMLECEEYDELARRAANACEICRVPAVATPQGRLHIDHDHGKGMWAVRGLLCSRCNTHLDSLAGSAVDAYLASPWRTTPPDAARIPGDNAFERARAELIAEMYQSGVLLRRIAADVGVPESVLDTTLRQLRRAGAISGYRR